MEMVVSPRLVGIDDDPRVAAGIFGKQRRKAVAQLPRDIGRGAVIDVEESRHPGAYLILPGIERGLAGGVEPTRKMRVSSEPSPFSVMAGRDPSKDGRSCERPMPGPRRG